MNIHVHNGTVNMDDAAEVIEKLKTRFRVETDSDLAARLLISRSSIANWRNRESVPTRYRRIADGEVNWAAYATPYPEMSDVERAAMRIAIMRLIRDFSGVGSDYRCFLEHSMKAAASWQLYWAQACRDLYQEMELRDADNAHHTADLLAYRELSTPK
jgi:Bacteriophage CI repressor helix-turn-helix domain